MFGIINVYKEKSMTSFDVIAKLRKILNEKRIGHTGTLDPNATGVLPICIGKATKLSQYILNEDKQYFVTIKLGVKTNSGDITGKVIEEQEVPNLKNADIVKIVNKFIGKSKQTPPMYSALKVNGKKLYELARLGLEIERVPRDIEIYNISEVKYIKKSQTLTMLVDCSKGTYIRVLAEDICEKLGTVGTLEDLERTRTGVFKKEQTYKLGEIEKLVEKGKIDKILFDLEDVFAEYEGVNISSNKWENFLNGVKLPANFEDGIYKVYSDSDELKGLGRIENKKIRREFIIE